MNRHDLTEANLLSTLALDYANSKRSEPPWYGFFGMILQDQMTPSRVEDKVATFFVPQLPITAEFEVEDDEDDIDSNNENSDQMVIMYRIKEACAYINVISLPVILVVRIHCFCGPHWLLGLIVLC